MLFICVRTSGRAGIVGFVWLYGWMMSFGFGFGFGFGF